MLSGLDNQGLSRMPEQLHHPAGAPGDSGAGALAGCEYSRFSNGPGKMQFLHHSGEVWERPAPDLQDSIEVLGVAFLHQQANSHQQVGP